MNRRLQSKRLAGAVVSALLPHCVRRVADRRFTMSVGAGEGALDRLIRWTLADRATRRGDHAALAEYHRHFWQADDARQFHDGVRHRFESDFLQHCGRAVEALRDAARQHRCHTLCEIGTGSGQVLAHLAEALPDVAQLVGLDLSAAQIKRNLADMADSRLSFVAADARQWIPEHGNRHWIFFTNGGVFEYFTQRDLSALLSTITDRFSPSLLLSVEPLADDHELSKQPSSRPYGLECSFSHNYPELLERAGWSILLREEHRASGQRMLAVLACT